MLTDKIHAEIERTGAGGRRMEMEQIREYVAAYENGSPLVANGLHEGYRIMAEFGGYVLAGYQYTAMEAGNGYQFATWQYVNSKAAVEHGHYYPTWSFGTSAFDLAKQDFALRSGLMDESFVFKPEQYMEMYEALDFFTRMNADILTLKQEESIKGIMEQLERLLPEPAGQEEAAQGQKQGL